VEETDFCETDASVAQHGITKRQADIAHAMVRYGKRADEIIAQYGVTKKSSPNGYARAVFPNMHPSWQEDLHGLMLRISGAHCLTVPKRATFRRSSFTLIYGTKCRLQSQRTVVLWR